MAAGSAGSRSRSATHCGGDGLRGAPTARSTDNGTFCPWWITYSSSEAAGAGAGSAGPGCGHLEGDVPGFPPPDHAGGRIGGPGRLGVGGRAVGQADDLGGPGGAGGGADGEVPLIVLVPEVGRGAAVRVARRAPGIWVRHRRGRPAVGVEDGRGGGPVGLPGGRGRRRVRRDHLDAVAGPREQGGQPGRVGWSGGPIATTFRRYSRASSRLISNVGLGFTASPSPSAPGRSGVWRRAGARAGAQCGCGRSRIGPCSATATGR